MKFVRPYLRKNELESQPNAVLSKENRENLVSGELSET